ncbi:MAG: TetR/AcrR family transcriptional regulator [Deltaproteobacteria bacterium]|nr:TetR/AcrR family transcriptional regulator [Deltaproteobacteria bacterium]
MGKTKPNRRVGRPQAKGATSPAIKDDILAKTLELISMFGINNFSLKDVSLQAKVTPAAIYYYFPSKKELIQETLDKFVLPLFRELWDLIDQTEEPLLLISNFQTKILELATRCPWFIPLWIRELADTDKMVIREYLSQNLDQTFIPRFCQKIRLAQESNLINPDLQPEMVYISLFSNIFIPLLAADIWPQTWGFTISREKLLKHIFSFTLKGMLGNIPQEDDNTPKTPLNDPRQP